MLTVLSRYTNQTEKEGRQYSRVNFFQVSFINGFSTRAFFIYIPTTATTCSLLPPSPSGRGFVSEGNLKSPGCGRFKYRQEFLLLFPSYPG